MEFKFEEKQLHQLDAISAVLDLFDGQLPNNHTITIENEIVAVNVNQLDISEETLLRNLQRVQSRNYLTVDNELSQSIKIDNEVQSVDYFNFSVEMETGTGKTYVYIRTALELARKYGLRKFIIVVPSIAIREGVLKTFQMTKKHFANLYNNLPYEYFEYDSKRLSNVSSFATTSAVAFMIMTVDAFNKSSNVIHRSTDSLNGIPAINYIQATRPILIIDEPQSKTEGEKNILALAELNPLLTLRYSATHRNPHNRVYRLTPFDAYRQGLVKQVEVASVVREDNFNTPYIKALEASLGKSVHRIQQTSSAKVMMHVLTASGAKEKKVTLKLFDELYAKSGLPEYIGYRLKEIHRDYLEFDTGGNPPLRIPIGDASGDNRDEILRSQVFATVKEHFERQKRLREKSIKVLTLFFVDRVDNYQNNGKIRRWFAEAFNQLKADSHYSEWAHLDPEDVQEAYFATKKGKNKADDGTALEENYDDSSTGDAEKDKAAYELIMRDKERLLSFDEPVAFVFSHTALNEGWDNPNIFQICVLREIGSYVTKRQQIGRGLRLPVDQDGNRVYEPNINVLTVIANETYSQFVEAYQREIEEVYGTREAAPVPTNANEKVTVSRKEYQLNDDFRTLWENISQKTRYAVKIDSESLINDVVLALQQTTIHGPRIAVMKASVELTEDDTFEGNVYAVGQGAGKIQQTGRMFNLVDRIAHLLRFHSVPISLTRQSIGSIISKSGMFEQALQNPHEFATVTVRLLRENLAKQLVRGIKYTPINEYYEMTLFEESFESWKHNVTKVEKSIYDHIAWDSNSSIERQLVEDMERYPQVVMYLKLPRWFRVATPVGEYNPDWAIVWTDEPERDDATKRLYLVRETKGEGSLRITEDQKVEFGRKHFSAIGANYQVITSITDLPDRGDRHSN